MILVSDNQPSKLTNTADGALDHIASPFPIPELQFVRLIRSDVLRPLLMKRIAYRRVHRLRPALVGIASKEESYV